MGKIGKKIKKGFKKGKKAFKRASKSFVNKAIKTNLDVVDKVVTGGVAGKAAKAVKALLNPKFPSLEGPEAGDEGAITQPGEILEEFTDQASEPSQSTALQILRRRAKRRRQGVVANASGLTTDAGNARSLVGL